jgi:uncharacterized glyoxalase superfamily protein PhnB
MQHDMVHIPHSAAIALVVDDIDAVRDALAAAGIEVTDMQLLGPDLSPGTRFLLFKDSDGKGWAIQEAKP